jgi:hypothetical protein
VASTLPVVPNDFTAPAKWKGGRPLEIRRSGLRLHPWKPLVTSRQDRPCLDRRSFQLYRSACLMNLSSWVADTSAAWDLAQCSSPVRVCSVRRRIETLP